MKNENVTEIKDKLTERIMFEGADKVLFANIGKYLPDRLSALPFSISVIMRLSEFTVSEISEAPTRLYFHNYRSTNALLDRITLLSVGILQRNGYQAIAVPASQTENNEEISGLISHKLAAVHAGGGYIGKNALYIDENFGPAVRLATVLTDCPLSFTDVRAVSKCGNCTKCADACPAHAIKGVCYEEGMSREMIVDAALCSEYMKQAYKDIGRGAVCGRCIHACISNRFSDK